MRSSPNPPRDRTRGGRRAIAVAALTACLALTGACSSTTAPSGTQSGAPSGTQSGAPSGTQSGTPGGNPGTSGTPTGSAPGSAGAAQAVTTADELYEVPAPIPDSAHGTLLKYQDITPGTADEVRAYRIMYTSRSVQERPIVVTGVALVPTVAAPPEGRVTLTIAHGTTGVADECAPSKGAQGSEISGMRAVAKEGWLVALTDYEGLGTPGRHPYLVGPSEGRSTIDAALAARSLPGADAGPKLAIAGYSQGGHGALWAAEVAPTWAPELQVVGTFAGAPATENDVILKAAAHLPINGFSFMMIAGYQAAYPEADPALVLTDAGLAKLDAVDNGCTAEVFKATAGPPEQLIKADGTAKPPWSTLMAQNNPGNTRTDSPVLIIHSDDDTTVPVGLSGILHDRMCRNGQVVERRVLHGAGGHVGAAPAAYVAGLAWLKDRVAGLPPVNDCGSTPPGTS